MNQEILLKGLMAMGIGISGVIYDRLRYSVRAKNETNFVRTRLVWASWAFLVVGLALIILSFLNTK
jgi:hypothetical protein